MSAKTMFYAFAVVALAAVWSAAALPLVVDDVTSPGKSSSSCGVCTYNFFATTLIVRWPVTTVGSFDICAGARL